MVGLMSDESRVVLRNDLSEIERLSEFVTEFGVEHHLPPKVTFALNLSLEEIVTNVISYGYDDGCEHQILVRLSVEEGEATAQVEDDGRAFNPLEAPTPDIDKPLEERSIGGLGIHLVRSLMEKLEYDRRDERNILVMRKRIEED
jgi:anti-sigma regulatory factor (Ser/Thr protein kinase)